MNMLGFKHSSILMLTALLLSSIPSRAQRHFNIEDGTATAIFMLPDSTRATTDDLEIILDIRDSLLWIGLHPATLHIDNEKIKKSLKKQKSFIIEGQLYPDPEMPTPNSFLFSGFVRYHAIDSVFGVVNLRPLVQNFSYQVQISISVCKSLFGKKVSRKMNEEKVLIDIPKTVLTQIDLEN